MNPLFPYLKRRSRKFGYTPESLLGKRRQKRYTKLWKYINIGRIKRRDVFKNMDLTYQSAKHKDDVEHLEKTTLGTLM